MQNCAESAMKTERAKTNRKILIHKHDVTQSYIFQHTDLTTQARRKLNSAYR